MISHNVMSQSDKALYQAPNCHMQCRAFVRDIANNLEGLYFKAKYLVQSG